MSLRDWEYFSFGTLVGVAAGIVAGFLLAPQEGTKTRKQIAGYVNVAKDSVSDLLFQARENLEIAVQKAEGLIGNDKARVKKIIEEIRDQIKDLEASEV